MRNVIDPKIAPYVLLPRDMVAPGTPCLEEPGGPLIGSPEWYETASEPDLEAHRKIFRLVQRESVLTPAGMRLLADWFQYALDTRGHVSTPWVSSAAKRERRENGRGQFCTRFVGYVVGDGSVVPDGELWPPPSPLGGTKPHCNKLEVAQERTRAAALHEADKWSTYFAVAFVLGEREAQLAEIAQTHNS